MIKLCDLHILTGKLKSRSYTEKSGMAVIPLQAVMVEIEKLKEKLDEKND